MTITNLSSLRKNYFQAINNVIEFDEPLTICTNKGNVVIMSEEEYSSLIETAFFSSNEGLMKKIKDGEKENIKNMSIYNSNEEW